MRKAKDLKTAVRNKMLAAVSRWASKELGKAELPEGEFPVELTIEGTVDGVEIGDACLGTLTKSGEQTYTATYYVPAAYIMARLWKLLPKTKQKHALADMLEEFRLEGKLLKTGDDGKLLAEELDIVRQFDDLQTKLRSFGTTKRRGACSFQQRTLDAA